MADTIDRHHDVQESLDLFVKLGIIAEWATVNGRYTVRRSAGAVWTRLGHVGVAEAFTLGVYSALNGLRRRKAGTR